MVLGNLTSHRGRVKPKTCVTQSINRLQGFSSWCEIIFPHLNMHFPGCEQRWAAFHTCTRQTRRVPFCERPTRIFWHFSLQLFAILIFIYRNVGVLKPFLNIALHWLYFIYILVVTCFLTLFMLAFLEENVRSNLSVFSFKMYFESVEWFYLKVINIFFSIFIY